MAFVDKNDKKFYNILKVMSFYVPVLTGGAEGLRRSVEALLDGGQPDRIDQHIAHSEERIYDLGYTATFGAEPECTFVPIDARQTLDIDTDRDLHVHILDQLTHPADVGKVWPKGAIIHPNECKSIIMPAAHINGSDNELQPGVHEPRTAPATALEFVERYWKVLSSVGSIAATGGFYTMLLSSQFNSVVVRNTSPDDPIQFYFKNGIGGHILAAFQYNWQALRALQIDAGLVDGAIIVEEAFPSKDALTAIHQHRIESRQPTVAVADPKLVALAMLRSVEQAATRTVPAAALAAMRQLRYPEVVDEDRVDSRFLTLINGALWDQKAERLVMPGVLGKEAIGDAQSNTFITEIDNLVEFLSEGAIKDYLTDNGSVLREALKGLRFQRAGHHRWRVAVHPKNRYAKQLREITRDVQLRTYHPLLRTIPRVTLETTASALYQRHHIRRSSTVRGILGTAIDVLPSAKQAFAERQKLINEHMLVEEE